MVRVPRRPLRRRLRRVRARKPSRRKWWIAAALAVAALLWLWPRAPEPEKPPVPEPPHHGAPPVHAARIAPVQLHRPPAPPPLPDRDALAAFVREHSSALRDCALPGGALARLPVQLHIASSGVMRSVEFTGNPPPSPPVAACVRKTAMQWSFADFHLRSDVDLLLSLSFAPSVR